MKIIFLDIDGVLNYRACWERPNSNKSIQDVWDHDCVNELNRIVEETNAKIVVSSTWRLFNDAYTLVIEKMGIKEGVIIDKTKDYLPKPYRTCRGDEIQDWLDNTEYGVESFIILDDDDDMGRLLPYLIQTDFDGKGLTKEIADKAILFLNK